MHSLFTILTNIGPFAGILNLRIPVMMMVDFLLTYFLSFFLEILQEMWLTQTQIQH